MPEAPGCCVSAIAESNLAAESLLWLLQEQYVPQQYLFLTILLDLGNTMATPCCRRTLHLHLLQRPHLDGEPALHRPPSCVVVQVFAVG